MSADPTFRMVVQDVLYIRGRETVVTGQIDTGTVTTGHELRIQGKSSSRTAMVSGVEVQRKVTAQAKAGDNVGILMKDITDQDVQPGDVLMGSELDFTWKEWAVLRQNRVSKINPSKIWRPCMESSLLQRENDIQAMRTFRAQLATRSTVVDFDEQILLQSVRETTRIWRQSNEIVGFAFIDEYCNLWFDTEPGFNLLEQLETEIIEWGITCMKEYNAKTGVDEAMECTCNADDTHRLSLFKKHGFISGPVRSLQYSRPLDETIVEYPLPSGFSTRPVQGKEEVEQLVELHRSAFGTNHMTIKYRLAMMNAPQYVRELDLVAVTANGELAAFCVCGFDDPGQKTGYTDPIGTHPAYQRLGLGKALVSMGLSALKRAGATHARLGTSSDNIAMQRLAETLGFVCISEKLWFSKIVS